VTPDEEKNVKPRGNNYSIEVNPLQDVPRTNVTLDIWTPAGGKPRIYLFPGFFKNSAFEI
jgi:hypothetical protein